MNDREMLELAAEAAGYVYENGVLKNQETDFEYDGWNPLKDDGDALRLAVKLGIEVDPKRQGSASAKLRSRIFVHAEEPHGGDHYAAARRAIVRAASEIGRQMQEGGAA